MLLGADLQHRLPGDVRHVRVQGEGNDGIVRQTQLPRVDPHHPVGQVLGGEDLVDLGEGDAEGVGDAVGEDQRCGAVLCLTTG